jgi:hypothetical protein
MSRCKRDMVAWAVTRREAGEGNRRSVYLEPPMGQEQPSGMWYQCNMPKCQDLGSRRGTIHARNTTGEELRGTCCRSMQGGYCNLHDRSKQNKVPR